MCFEKFIHCTTFVYMKRQNKSTPFPVRLGNKKAFLMQEASEKDRSLHYLINKILEKHLDESGNIKWMEQKLKNIKQGF